MPNNPYETMLIMRSEVTEEPLAQFVEQQKALLTEQGAVEFEVHIWGKKRLAYEINRQKEGVYLYFNFEAEPTTIAAFEKQLRFNEQVLRYMTIRPDLT